MRDGLGSFCTQCDGWTGTEGKVNILFHQYISICEEQFYC